jgi:hypothetical protein
MENGVIIATLIASLVGVLVTIRYLLGVKSKRVIVKIGIFRSMIKIIVGLLTGFCMALLLNATQYLQSMAVELTIIGSFLVFGLLASLKAYQVLLSKMFDMDRSLMRLFKISVLEFLVGIVFLAAVLAINVTLGPI